MHVFVTGASGFIGSAVVRDLLDAGHSVTGLARSAETAKELRIVGANAHEGDLDDLASLQAGAEAADGVIHLAFGHDFSAYAAATAANLRAVEAIGSTLVGSDQPFVIASGTLALSFAGGVGTEDVELDPALPRVASEHAMTALAGRGVRSSVVRLAPSVHDHHRAGLVSRLIDVARRTGVAGYLDEGTNVWPAVHRLDAARLFRLALESSPAGARFHGADEQVSMKAIAEAIATGLGIETVSVPSASAAEHFGDFALFVGLDNPTTSEQTRAQLDWEPSHPQLLADLAEGEHFS